MTRARGARRHLRVLLAAVLASSGLAVVAVPAHASPNEYAPSIGTVTGATAGPFLTTASFNVKGSVSCPSADTVVNAYIDSATAGWTQGQVLAISANNTDVPNLTTTGIPLSDSLFNLAAAAGKTLVDGTYEFSLVCLPDVFSTANAQLDGSFTVTGTAVSWAVPGVTTTATTLSAAPVSPSPLGSAVQLTAAVTPAGATGTVQFTDTTNGVTTNLGPAVTLTGGTAGFSATGLTAGVHSLKAVFTSATGAFSGSSSVPLAYTVLSANQKATATSLAVTPPGGSTVGSTVTLTATVTPDTAVGSVTFTDAAGGSTLADAVPVASGTATFTTSSLAAGLYTLTAAFTPTDPAAFSASASSSVSYSVTTTDTVFLGLTVIKPSSGVATEAPTVTTPRGCPAGADSVSLSLLGPGAWSGGVNVPVTATVSTTDAFDIVTTPVAQVAGVSGLAVVPGAYQYVATCRQAFGSATFGFFLGQIWFYDAVHWLNQDPAVVGIPTVTKVIVSPADRADVAAPVTFTAVVDPPQATGSVVFQSTDTGTTTTIGSATVTNGRAVLTTSGLGFGLYYVVGVFTSSSSSAKYVASTSTETVFVVAKPLPPLPPPGASVTGTARVGRVLTCSGAFRNAQSLAYVWWRDGLALSGSTRPTYTVVAADRGRTLRCVISATNSGGTTSRTSAPVVVGR